MKVVILAGGAGSRLAEETQTRPKPMVEVGGRPILWHIMKHYSHYGFNEFVVPLGYKGDMIKKYFLDYHTLDGSLTLDLGRGHVEKRGPHSEPWTVHLVDTGLSTLTGGRVGRLREWLGPERFMLTYGDGVSNVPLDALVRFHERHGRIATLTAVRPPARFGGLVLEGDVVGQFSEKPQIAEGWINGGYMVLEPTVYEYIAGDDSSLEKDVLERLGSEQQLVAYRHEEFWQCMDTLRDVRLLEELWQGGSPPWRVWE